MKKIIGFDFDGVICDSTNECLITGYNAWLDYQNINKFIAADTEVPAGLADYFRSWRGFVRTADQYFAIFKSYAEQSPLRGEADFERRVLLDEPERSLYAKKFFAAREKLRNQNLEYWIGLNCSYDGFPDDFKKIIAETDVYIVSSGKDKASVLTFLSSLGIDFPAEKIYDNTVARDKLVALKTIAEINNEKLENIIFIDDNINHVMNVKQGGCKIFMAGWGYHSEGHICQAIINNVDVVSLVNWREQVLSALDLESHLEQSVNQKIMELKKEIDRCVNCQSDEFQFITNKLRHNKIGTVVKCKACGLVRLAGALAFENKSQAFYQQQYAAEYHQGVKAELDSLFDSFLPVQQERIKKMKKYLKSSDSVLEIGSSTGYFLHAAKPLVRDVCGIEYNRREAEYATTVKGIKTDNQPLGESVFANQRFDHICLFQLLEHVANPVHFLQEIKEYLTPTGLIHIEIPNIQDPLVALFDNVPFRDFFYQEPHLYYYDPQTLVAVVSRAGMTIESLEPFQQTSITNTLNWIYRAAPQPCRWDCIQAVLPTNCLAAPKIKNQVDRLVAKMDLEYKNILEEAGLTDNIFCILKK